VLPVTRGAQVAPLEREVEKISFPFSLYLI
jgi:hypothetical protein